MTCVFHSQNRILWIDEKNLTAHVEAGIVGQDLERLVSTAHPSIFIHERAYIAVPCCANNQAVRPFTYRLPTLSHLATLRSVD